MKLARRSRAGPERCGVLGGRSQPLERLGRARPWSVVGVYQAPGA